MKITFKKTTSKNKLSKIAFLLLFFCSFSLAATAQLPKNLKNKAQKAVNTKLKGAKNTEEDKKQEDTNQETTENEENKKNSSQNNSKSTKLSTTNQKQMQEQQQQSVNDEKAELFQKMKPLTELYYIAQQGSGMLHEIIRMKTELGELNSQEVKNFPTKIEELKTKGANVNSLTEKWNEFTRAFENGNEFFPLVITELQRNYNDIEKPYFTTEKLDELQQANQAGVVVFDIMTSVFPQNQAYKGYFEKVKNIQSALDKKLNSKYAANYTSDFHATNAKKILLSSKTITLKEEKTSQFQNSFVVGESIKGMLYLNEKVKTYNEGYTFIGMDMYIDEGISDNPNSNTGCLSHVSYKTIVLSEQETENAYISFDLIPDAEKTNHIPSLYIKKFAECMSNLMEGKHKVRIRIALLPAGHQTAYTTSNTFETDFELEVTQEGLKVLATKVEKIEAAELAGVRMENAGMKDATLENMVKEAAAKNGHTPTRVVLVSKNWSQYTHKDKLNRTIPSYQRVYAEYAFTDTDGKCYVQSVDILKDYVGDGKYTAAYTKASSEYRRRILCENVQK